MARMGCSLKKVIHTSSGHTVFFPGGKEYVDVPAHLVEDCLKQGAYTLPGEEVVFDHSEAPPEELQLIPAERKRRAVELFQKMIESPETYRSRFTAAGRPNTKFVQSTLGFKVAPQEVEEWWDEAKP